MYPAFRKKRPRVPDVSIIKFIVIFVCGFATCWLSFEMKSTFKLHQVFTNYCPSVKCECPNVPKPDKPPTTMPVKALPSVRPISNAHCDSYFTDWSKKNDYTLSEELLWYNMTQCKKVSLPECKSKKLVGPLAVDFKHIDMKVLKEKEASYVKDGGWLAPSDCKVKAHTALIVPFRNRESHLPILLHQILPIFYRQNQHFRVFVIEQSQNYTFNRGKLMNVGYREALRSFPYTCFVFHDVDLIPENDEIDFSCENSPAHLSVAIDKFNYKLIYDELFGGAEMLTRDHFEHVNGFSNSFWMWGGEDDNLYQRVKKDGLTLKRQSEKTARYKMIQHDESKDKTKVDQDKRYQFYKSSLDHMDTDGLSNLQYDVISRFDKLLYTHITVNLRKDLDLEFGKRKYGEDELVL